MVNVNRWYFQKTADIINDFRLQVDPQDPSGGSLLDNMVIPMITEVAEASHTREGHGAIIFGGGKLGMQGGQYQERLRYSQPALGNGRASIPRGRGCQQAR